MRDNPVDLVMVLCGTTVTKCLSYSNVNGSAGKPLNS
ncbi:hypothetical protein BMETH_2299_0 [methanotrophic bacterial endosymbiont of Bathymodiolus sp.]|nr:hypothetical protein BMETH_2299_0 [methanotrophic bacterial endosymbiont of Bathymodiolus sp.]